MTNAAPPIDTRTADVVTAQLKARIADYTGYDASRDPLGGALTAIAGRFAELIIQRLNQVPDKQFLAFLDLLGASRIPPQPARVPLTFSLTTGSVVPGIVPAGTQVAAAPAQGDDHPIVFETERELVVLPARVTAAFVRDPRIDAYADVTALCADTGTPGVDPFAGDANRHFDHVFHISLNDAAGRARITNAKIEIAMSSAAAQTLPLTWEAWTAAGWKSATPATDGTQGLKVNGIVDLGALPPLPLNLLQTADGKQIPGRWVRCTLPGPLTQPPVTISEMHAHVTLGSDAAPPDAAFANGVALDVSKAFMPFGSAPAAGDAFFIRSDDLLSIPGAAITLNITLGQAGVGDAVLSWEIWADGKWTQVSQESAAFSTPQGTVTVTCPAHVAPTAVNGVQGFWMRGRIVSGGYGQPAHYEQPDKTKPDVVLVPSTLMPPIVSTFSLKLQALTTDSVPPVVTYNDFHHAVFTGDGQGKMSFAPFTPTSDPLPTFYLGFEVPSPLTAFPNRPVSLYIRTRDTPYIPPAGAPAPSAPVARRLVWEYWNGAWAALNAYGDASSFARSGTVEFIAPADMLAAPDFGRGPRYWIRVRPDSLASAVTQGLTHVLLNTVMAAETATMVGEMLGSSDGTAKLRFAATRAPILPGEWLDVREPELPPASERPALTIADGPDASVWVRWLEVPDFYASGPRDRHYVVDRLAGQILFGDGENGLVPPVGINNVRLARYQTGGGRSGNRPAGSIVQLKTTVPYVDKVTNLEPATGGADAEPLPSVSARVPREVRHGGRAVTVEDYADLAFEASPDVARALCVPLVDVAVNPVAPAPNPEDPSGPGAGTVSVLIVPQSDAVKPAATIELIARVQDYLNARCGVTAKLTVAGPIYVRVDVTAAIAPVSIDTAASVLAAVEQAIVSFLHPLTGGPDGRGWDFGRQPYRSDLFAVIESVPGVDHVVDVQFTEAVDKPWALEDVHASGRFMVYAGTPSITCR